MPDGRWYRICDLSNGANQGPAMNALEVCAGVDDIQDDRLRLMPRVPDPLKGIEVTHFRVMTREAGRNVSAWIDYTYERGGRFAFQSDRLLPEMDVRFGPYVSRDEADRIARSLSSKGEVRVEESGRFRDEAAYWVWLEGLKNIQELQIEQPGL